MFSCTTVFMKTCTHSPKHTSFPHSGMRSSWIWLSFYTENVTLIFLADLMAPSSLSLSFFFLTCIFLLLVFSLWISWSVSLSSLFIYFLSYLSLCLLSVSLVKSKLDPESLGIILLGPFLLEFFPDQVCAYVCVRRGGLPLQRRKHKQDDIYLLPAIQSTPHS